MKSYLLLPLLFLMACGEDTKTADALVPPSNANEKNLGLSPEKIEQFRAQCIDQNLPYAESQKNHCLDLQAGNPTYSYGCESAYQERILRLKQTWSQIEATSLATYHQCETDIRLTKDMCLAKYEEEIATKIAYSCYSAVI